MPTPDVTVLAVVRNEEVHLPQMAASILGQDYEGEIEYLFIDGCSDDRTGEILQDLASADGRIRLLTNPKRLLAAGLNQGITQARGEVIVHAEGHTIYPPDFVRVAASRLAEGDVDWVSARPEPFGIDRFSTAVSAALGSWMGTGGAGKWSAGEPGTEVELDTGVFAGAWRKQTLERMHGFNEEWLTNPDSELAARILADGGRIVGLADLSARYAPRSSALALARQYLRYGFYRAKTGVTHPNSFSPRHLFPPLLAVAAVTALLGRPRRLRIPARGLLGAYAVALAASSRSAAAKTESNRLDVALALAVMHLSWGAGYAAGLVRFAPVKRSRVAGG